MSNQPARAAQPPPVVRVFISSTFRDMHAEREELIKRVFPRLRNLCEARGVAWSEVDLRWGITAEEASQGKVLPICLAEVKNCPFFIGLLGERYGWVPDAEALRGQEPLPADRAGCSITELEFRSGVLQDPPAVDHAFVYFRDPAYLQRLPAGADPADFACEGSEARARLDGLKQRLRASPLVVHRDYPDPAAAGRMVLDDLTALIERLYPAVPPGPFEREAAAHEAFADSRSRVYVGRQEYFDRLNDHVAGDQPPLVVFGGPGSGKSALLANWTRLRLARHSGALRLSPPSRGGWFRLFRRPADAPPPPTFGADTLLVVHHVGASPHSSDGSAMLRRILAELQKYLGVRAEIPEQPAALRTAFATWLQKAAARRRVILVLDGLDQLEDRDQALDLLWLPTEFAANARLILSAAGGRPLAELRRRGWPTLEVQPLRPAERARLVEDHLGRFRKRLEPESVRRITSAAQTASPLYLRTLLEELRVLGRPEQVAARAGYYLAAAALDGLYERVFARLEEDYDRDRPRLVRDTLTLLWAARHGLSESELLELLGPAGTPLPSAVWSPLYLAIKESVVNRSGLLAFFHQEMRAAVGRRYLPGPQEQRAAHQRLADYFAARPQSPRTVQELPWQLATLGSWHDLAALLAAPWFLEAAWANDQFEVKAYWSRVEAGSPHRLADAYRPLVQAPDGFPAQFVRVVSLLLGDTSHPQEALALSAHLERRAREAANPKALQESLSLRAGYCKALGDLAGALKLLQEQEQISRRLQDLPALAACLTNQGVILRDQGRGEEAMACHEAAESICRAAEDWEGLGACLCNQGVIRFDRKDRAGALELFQRQEQICREHGDLAGLHKSLGNQAVVHADAGDLKRALEWHAEEEAICRRLNDAAGLHVSLGNQASLREQQGDYDGAMKLLDEKEEICRSLSDPAGLAETRKKQASLFGEKLGQPRYALPLAEEALRLATQHGLGKLQADAQALLLALRARLTD
jgi:tetratricopeptide (TPR) repeat protein